MMGWVGMHFVKGTSACRCVHLYTCVRDLSYAHWSQAGPMAWASLLSPADLGVPSLFSLGLY